MKNFLIFLGCLGLFAHQKSFAADSFKVIVAAEGGKTEFRALGKPQMLKILGEGPGPLGTILVKEGKVTGELELSLKSFTTGVELRDSHMKNKYLEISKFPTAKLEILEIKVPATTEMDKSEVPFKGQLTLHGEKKPIMGLAKISISDGAAKVVAGFSFKVADYKIEIPSYLGITVANEIQTEVTFSGQLAKTDVK